MQGKALSIAGCAALALGGCDQVTSDAPDGEPARTQGYTIDSATGEHRLEIPRKDGSVALRAGPKVPVRLPPGFSLFPGAQVIHNTRVSRPGGESTLVTFSAEAPAAAVIAHYRKEALAAGFVIAAELDTGDARTIIAERAGDGAKLSLTVTGSARADAALTIDTGAG